MISTVRCLIYDKERDKRDFPLSWESLFCLFHKIKINNEIKKTREKKSIKEIKLE